MTLELWSTIATFGTFVVIAVTALVALFQLRHARGSNQIAALDELNKISDSPHFRDALHFINGEFLNKMKEPAFRHQVMHKAARTSENSILISKVVMMANFYENMGLLVKAGFLDRELAMQTWSEQVSDCWALLAGFTAVERRKSGNAMLENFEYLAVLAQDWIAAHPDGAYPLKVRRIKLADPWLEADTQYAASNQH